MQEILDRLQQDLDNNAPCEAADIQAVVDFARERQWVSVEDRLPKDNGLTCKHFRVYRERGLQQRAAYQFRPGVWFDLDSLEDLEDITHWQPLPKPPQTNEE